MICNDVDTGVRDGTRILQTFRIILHTSLFFLTAACATSVRDGRQDVTFVSLPVGAKVTVVSFDGKQYYPLQTPSTVILKSNDRYIATFQFPGYHTQTIPVVNSVGGGTIGSAAAHLHLGDPASGRGLLINARSGGIVGTLPEKLELHFTPIEAPEPTNAISYDVVLERIRVLTEEMEAERRSRRVQKPGQIPIGLNRAPACKVFECEEIELVPPKCVNPKSQRRLCK